MKSRKKERLLTTDPNEKLSEVYNGLLKFVQISEEDYEIISKEKKNESVEALFDENKTYIQKALYTVFPVRKITIDGVNSIPVKIAENNEEEDDIQTLCEEIEKKLEERQARRKGICDIRTEIYEEAFDELIRQVTLNCPERGMLLMRIKHEMKITIASYKHLYDSSVNFGIKKHIQAEKGVKEMKDRIKELEFWKEILENQKKDLTDELTSIKENFENRNTFEEEKMLDEIKFLQSQNKTLNEFLQGAMEDDEAFSTKRYLGRGSN